MMLSLDNLNDLKYAELQKLAKTVGIKANLKCAVLRASLREYAVSQQNQEDGHVQIDIVSSIIPEEEDVLAGSPDVAPLSEDDEAAMETSQPSPPKMVLNDTLDTDGCTARRRSSRGTAASPDGALEEVVDEPRRRSARLSASPCIVKEVLAAVEDSSKMDDAELKATLLNALDKTCGKGGSQIPRFAAYALQRKAEHAKSTAPVTPGTERWRKIHAKQFSKMDSIDAYLCKKRQRAETTALSEKKIKQDIEQTRAAINTLKASRTPGRTPGGKTRTHDDSKFPLRQAGLPFVPKVLSVKKINTNFSSMNKTVAAESPRKPITGKSPLARRKLDAVKKENVTKTPSRLSVGNKTFTKELNKSGAVTPFNFSAKKTANISFETRRKFDLSASLAKPLSYKVHTGKLPQFTAATRQDPKQRPVIAKEDRRAAAKQRQQEQRASAANVRRGITH